ncbi:uncharacterized protein EI90DRAFT_3051097 [Cantharellus anzutake]|uniref:uncharacterized protein n=1 Tax=Cantharellus anzutake TaxID=1750568 RepID=UPI001908D921|nr:uncharacterized protein EI90DRAFT_3051097 [Cantharellus anzutake]KAF8334115.1 hypothetical protein EI90DRAFT_3051097 [Cantharellus anzutake]
MQDIMDYLPANRNHDDFLFVRQHGSQMFPLPHSDTPATTETFTSFPASGQPPLLQTPPPFDTYFPPPPYDAFTYAENPSQSQPYLSDFERNELILTAYGPNAGLPANLGPMDGQLQFESAPPTSGTMPWLPTDGFVDGLLGPVFASDTTPYLTADGPLDGPPQAGPEPTAPTFTFDTTPLWPAGDGGFPFDETLSWNLGMM